MTERKNYVAINETLFSQIKRLKDTTSVKELMVLTGASRSSIYTAIKKIECSESDERGFSEVYLKKGRKKERQN